MATPVAGAAVGALINMIDDVAFNTADLTTGDKNMGEWGLAMGKSAAKGLISFAGGAASAAISSIGSELVDKVTTVAERLGTAMTKAALNTAVSVGTGVANSAVDAVNFDSHGRLGFNSDMFMEGAVGVNAIAGYFGGFASGIVSGSLGAVNLYDTAGKALNGGTFNTRMLQQMNNFAGGLVSGGIQYAMTGNLTLNVLNIGGFMDMIGGRVTGVRHGLLEVHLLREGGGRE